MLKVKLLTEKSHAPTKGHSNDAGWDLYSLGDCIVEKGKSAIIKTGIAVQIPDGYYGRIADRSGNAAKYQLHVLAGVVDSSFRGELKVVLMNFSQRDYVVFPNDRIAQLVITKIYADRMVIVPELEESSRGENGFGSTGK